MIKRLTTAEEVLKFPFSEWVKSLYPHIIQNQDVMILVEDDGFSGVVAEIHRGPTMCKLLIVWMQCLPTDKLVGLEFHRQLIEWGKPKGCRTMSFIATRDEVAGIMDKYKFTCVKTDTEVSKAI